MTKNLNDFFQQSILKFQLYFDWLIF